MLNNSFKCQEYVKNPVLFINFSFRDLCLLYRLANLFTECLRAIKHLSILSLLLLTRCRVSYDVCHGTRAVSISQHWVETLTLEALSVLHLNFFFSLIDIDFILQYSIAILIDKYSINLKLKRMPMKFI